MDRPFERHHEMGYSLLELLVVLAILGLIAVVAIPPIATSLGDMRLADDARAVAAALREVRDQALDEQRDISVGVDAHAANRLASTAGSSWPLSEGTTIKFASENDAERVFEVHGDGTTSGGAFQITKGRASAVVRVDSVTGAVEVGR